MAQSALLHCHLEHLVSMLNPLNVSPVLYFPHLGMRRILVLQATGKRTQSASPSLSAPVQPGDASGATHTAGQQLEGGTSSRLVRWARGCCHISDTSGLRQKSHSGLASALPHCLNRKAHSGIVHQAKGQAASPVLRLLPDARGDFSSHLPTPNDKSCRHRAEPHRRARSSSRSRRTRSTPTSASGKAAAAGAAALPAAQRALPSSCREVTLPAACLR